VAAANLVVKQGATETIEILDIVDGAGVALNPAGCSVRAQVRNPQSSATVLYEWTSQGATPNATVAAGRVTLSLPADVSTAFTWTFGYYDVELTDSAGKVARLAEGTITVSPQVTR
jgi:hypothetical protein